MPPRNKPAIYTLDHGIQVLAEYPIGKRNPYVRLRIKAHPFFDSKSVSGAVTVQRSRVLMTAKLGRKLLRSEHVHHKNEDRSDDRLRNLKVITAADHNKHHKTGSKHSQDAKKRIAASLALAYAEGRHAPSLGGHFKGRHHSAKTKAQLSRLHLEGLSSGRIKKQKPPIMRGQDSGVAKLTNQNVLEIRSRSKECKKTLAKEFGVCLNSIYNIINKTSWTHI